MVLQEEKKNLHRKKIVSLGHLTRTFLVALCHLRLVVADRANFLLDIRVETCLPKGPLKLPSSREKAPCFFWDWNS